MLVERVDYKVNSDFVRGWLQIPNRNNALKNYETAQCFTSSEKGERIIGPIGNRYTYLLLLAFQLVQRPPEFLKFLPRFG